MKSWDVVIIGAGVIGLSLAWRLRREGLRVLIVEKGEPGRESSYAAGGMIAHCDPHLPPPMDGLVRASAEMYPAFVAEVEAESGVRVDLRDQGTLAFFAEGEVPGCEAARRLHAPQVTDLEPGIAGEIAGTNAYWLPESSVDPRALSSALVKAGKCRAVDFVTGSGVVEVESKNGHVSGARTEHSTYAAQTVVNCAGAWASQLKPFGLLTHPAKGQMVCVVPAPDDASKGPLVQHVIRAPEIYIIPRSDRRMLLGATLEYAGFDKRTNAETVEKLYHAAAQIVPAIANTQIHDAWAGLRPASPDKLPLLGETSLPGYFAASGHYRDGIMLAPITAEVMTELITGKPPRFDLQPFSPSRF